MEGHYGVCRICGSEFALRKDGMIRLHRTGKRACPGSALKPQEES